MLLKESLKALGGLGLLSLGGKLVLRRIFEVCDINIGFKLMNIFILLLALNFSLYNQFVAEARSSEAFVALCLLTVAGTSLLTQKLGFSDTVDIFSQDGEYLGLNPGVFFL